MTVSEQLDDRIYNDLLAGAVGCVRSLKFEDRDFFVHGSNKSNKDTDLARRSLWHLYSIEVPHSLRRGIPPVGRLELPSPTQSFVRNVHPDI